MGDEATVFSDEELVILGEKEPAAVATEGQDKPPAEGEKPPVEGEKPAAEAKPEGAQPEHTEEEKAAAEKMGLRIEGGFILDDDGTKIPAKRWKELYRQAKDTERTATETTRKLNLFKELGPDKFYAMYPEEKPAGYKPAATREERKPAAPDMGNIGAMVVQGGPYNGQTLNEVYQVDPAYATAMQNQYLLGQRDAEAEERRRHEELRRESEQEVTAFSDQLSTEMFGKKAADLTEAESAKVKDSIQATLDWMARTKRGAGVLADAYFLMNRDGIVTKAREEGGKAALASLQKPPIPSVDTGSGKSVVGSDYESMTRDQLAAKIEGMSDAATMKFYKDGSAALRQKFPDLPWE